LLYLPCFCIVGVGCDRSMTRWPDPKQNHGEVLIKDDHDSEITAMAYHGSMLVWVFLSSLVHDINLSLMID
jgi:hypothetical protein